MENENQKKNNNPSKGDNSSQGRSGINDYIKYAGMGIQMLAIIAIFTWAGVKLDRRSGNENNLYTAILALLGVIIGIYTALRDFIHHDKDS